MSDESFFSKKGQRQIGTFIGQELLYDYITGQLDQERKVAVEEFLAANKEAQSNLQKIQNGLSYVQKLSQTKVSEALIERVTLPTKYSEVLMQKIRFNQWSPALKLGIEASIVAFGITVFAVLIPWHKLMDLRLGPKDVVLTEVDREYATKTVVETSAAPKDEIIFPDEGAQSSAAVVAVAAKNSNTVTTTTTTTTTTTAVIAKSENSANPPVKNKPAAEVTGVAATTAAVTEEKRQGELYRGSIDVTNVSAISPKLVERMQEMGARKAGQVDLGWNKSGDSAYFHFTMPSSRYEELLALLNEYGKLQISKEKHDRVMPEGILRLIITVDEKK